MDSLIVLGGILEVLLELGALVVGAILLVQEHGATRFVAFLFIAFVVAFGIFTFQRRARRFRAARETRSEGR